MDEFKEFTESLMDQLSVETKEEKEITELSDKIDGNTDFIIKFDDLKYIANKIFVEMVEKVNKFTGIPVSSKIRLKCIGLEEFKILKGKKVFPSKNSVVFVDNLFHAISENNFNEITKIIRSDISKFLVYSTYAKSYISKITTTYGDYYNYNIYLNEFILEKYPKIILYKYGKPYNSKFKIVRSGYIGALKTIIVEELVYSIQEKIQTINKTIVSDINSINEELAMIILDLDDDKVSMLSKYLKLETVPNEFPIAKRANLFFTLDPYNFTTNTLGHNITEFTKIEMDSNLDSMLPQLITIYKKWLELIRIQHVIFSIMGNISEFSVCSILKKDKNFHDYITIFVGTDVSSYQTKKTTCKTFIETIFNRFGRNSFKILMEQIPTIKELNEPGLYINKIKHNGV